MRAKPLSSLDSNALFELAVRSLAVRAQSSAEIRRKLRARAAQPDDVDAVVSRLRDAGYLSDARMAESLAANRLAHRQFGKGRVMQELVRRRIAPDIAGRVIQNVYAEVDEMALVESYILNKLKPSGNRFAEDKELARAHRKLLRAGFAPGIALRALKKFAHNQELLDRLGEAELA
jgi:regulatory protein